MVETVLGGVVIALVAGTIGKALGTNNNVKAPTCLERQQACRSLVTEKLDNLCEKIDTLTKTVNDKILTL